MLCLDHIAVAAGTLEQGCAFVERTLGVTVQPGGQHPRFATHNALLGLEDGLYLEVIAIDPDAPAPEDAHWFDLDRFDGAPRLHNWFCRTDDMTRALAQMPAGAGRPVALSRGDLRWQMAVPENGQIPYDEMCPAQIEWQGAAHPAARLTPSGLRLDRLVISHPAAPALEAALSGLLRDPRLVFEPSELPGLRADFLTPNGPRSLT